MISEAASVAATAQKNAADAGKVAATARKGRRGRRRLRPHGTGRGARRPRGGGRERFQQLTGIALDLEKYDYFLEPEAD